MVADSYFIFICLVYLPPVHTDGQQGEHVEGHRHVGDVVVDPTVDGTKDPNSEMKLIVPPEREGRRPTCPS